MTQRVCITGATGWAGSALAAAVFQSDDLSLVSAVSRTQAGKALGNVLGIDGLETVISGSVKEALQTPVDVLVDYTKPDVVKANVLAAIDKKVHVVIGTSGLTEDDFVEIQEAALRNQVGVIAAGNFSMTAVLLERFALEAARYLSSWEILDFASANKPDAPSGVSRQLASRLSEIKSPVIAYPVEKTMGPKESRGASFGGTQVHSIRLPGYTIALEIIFGEPEERLILRHEAGTGAEPYVRGALLAIRKVHEITGLTRSLERIL